MIRLGFAIFTSTFGMTTFAVTSFAQTTAPDLGPWVSGGSATMAVGGLVYVARLLASGRLVHSDSAAREKALEDMAERSMAVIMRANDESAEMRRFLIDAAGVVYGRRAEDGKP